MAKQLVNPIERHVEKVILGITGAVLIYAIAFYLVTTPNTLELGTEKVTPQTIDSKVAAKAMDVLDRIHAAQPKTTIPDPLAEKFASSLAPLDEKPLPPAVYVNPDVPLFDIGELGKAKLAAVITPDKPLTSQGRSTFALTVQGQPVNVPMDWVTVAIAFDVKKQTELLKKAYGSLRSDVVYGLPDLQRRMRRADGTWSDGDWKDIVPSPAAVLPKDPRFDFAEVGGQVITAKEDEKNREKFVNNLRDPLLQREIVRPRMYGIVNGSIWKFPLFGTYREVLMMDDELVRPNDPPANEPDDLYGLQGAPTKTAPTAPQTPEARLNQDLEDAQNMLKSAQADLSEEIATQAYNKGKDVRDARESSPALKQKAEKFIKDADQAIKDIHRQVLRGAARPRPAQGGEPTENKGRPVHLATQEIWANDATRDSLVGGETYQYRIRVKLFNMLAGMPDKMEDSKDAATIYLSSDWSEPSDPVRIEPSSYFFAVNDEKSKNEVKFDLYRWFDGLWVKAPHGFKATIGTAIAETQRTQVPSLEDPSETDNALVPYSADATIVDLDFDHPMRERKSGNDAKSKGVRFAGGPTSSTVITLIDGKGRLFQRDIDRDKANPLRRELEARLYKPTRQRPEK